MLLPKVVGAQSSQPWSWTSGYPTIVHSSPISIMGNTGCQSAFQSKDIDGEIAPEKVCITYGSKMNFGVAYDSWWHWRTLVSFGYDNRMHRMSGICDGYDGCMYMPQTDTMVVKQYTGYGFSRGLYIYKNFSKLLHPVVNQLSIEYKIDQWTPDYVFQNSDGYPWPIGGMGVSPNGQWVTVEAKNRGIWLLNLETMQIKRINNHSLYYGGGRDPSAEMDVTDDGKHVVIDGANANLTLFEVNDNCGDYPVGEAVNFNFPMAKPCGIAPFDWDAIIYRWSDAYRARFSADGGELTAYFASFVSEQKEVTLRAKGYAGQRLDYLALGDSYTSGEGETDDKYYVQGTNDEFEKCHLSTRSYPFLIAQMSGIDMNYMRSVACSGATSKDVIGDGSPYNGQNDRLSKGGLNFNDIDLTLAKTQARLTFGPGRVLQGGFVDEYHPNIITVGIGGNDAGLMNKLRTCIGFGTCNWVTDPVAKEQTAIEIKNLFPQLVKTYQKLHDDSPSSKIFAIGYPKVIDDTNECGLTLKPLLDSTERQFMNEGVTYLNQVIAAAARQVGVKFIDVQNSLGSHTLCGSLSPVAMNGIRLGDDNTIIDQLDNWKVIGQESFHPNSIGHNYTADAIFNAVGNLTTYNYCQTSQTVCPVDTQAPNPSTYWISGQQHNYPALRIATFTNDTADGSNNGQMQLNLDSQSFSPKSNINVEITSTPVQLGQFTSGDDGSFTSSVNLPNDLPEGYHTLHLIGLSYSGEPIEFYQVIKYQKPSVEPVEQTTDNEASDEPTHTPNIQTVNNTSSETPNDSVNLLGQLGDLAGNQTVLGSSLKKPSNNQPISSSNHGDTNNEVAVFIVSLLTLGIILIIVAKFIDNKLIR